MLAPWKKSNGKKKKDSLLKSRDITLLLDRDKDLSSQSYGLSRSHIQMWELDDKKGWVPKNWCLRIVLEKTLESPLECKKIKPVRPKGIQSWIFIWRTDTEAPVLWPRDAKNWLIGKDPDGGKDWKQEKGITEDEIVWWHHQLDGGGSWWWTGKLGVLQSMESQKAGHDWATE